MSTKKKSTKKPALASKAKKAVSKAKVKAESVKKESSAIIDRAAQISARPELSTATLPTDLIVQNLTYSIKLPVPYTPQEFCSRFKAGPLSLSQIGALSSFTDEQIDQIGATAFFRLAEQSFKLEMVNYLNEKVSSKSLLHKLLVKLLIKFGGLND